jgi:DNA-binding transcriptional ArsR family regulator
LFLTVLAVDKYFFVRIFADYYIVQAFLKLIIPMMVATQSSEQTPVSTVGTPEVLKINYHNLKKAALVLRALNHKLRQQILTLIETEKKITVTEIYVRMRLEQSVASQHLAILRRAGIVTTQRDGKFIYYTVNYKRIDEITDVVEDLVA